MKDLFSVMMAAALIAVGFAVWRMHQRLEAQEQALHALDQAVRSIHVRQAPRTDPPPVTPADLPPPIPSRFGR